MKAKKQTITIKKSNGRVYTPNFIVNNILDLSSYYGEKILLKHAIDNSCGDGAFLKEVVKRYCEESIKRKVNLDSIKKELEYYIHGIEIDEIERTKCIDNLENVSRTYGIYNVKWDIICGDALKECKFDGKMDFVLGNPPYIRIHNLGDSFDNVKNFSFAQSGMTDIYIVFYEIGIKMLNETGVLGYITPSSFFNSVAGSFMRRELIRQNLLSKVVNLRHFQAFKATTYTTIIILEKNRRKEEIEYYEYNERNLIPYYVDTLSSNDFYISDAYYFAKKSELRLLKKIFFNLGKSDILVKNGYATLCDGVFINTFLFQSKYIIPVIKASTGATNKIIYPYDENTKLISQEVLSNEKELYAYLVAHKKDLQKRTNEKSEDKYWYAFGRSQALNDTYRDKLSINTLLRTIKDWKIVFAPKGTGVYSGLYITSKIISYESIENALKSEEFISYIALLGKYKNGGYYTFSSKDVKSYLDYKFAYNGGLSNDE
ncbi:MAG: N-6 DNA methylase [Clostridia bacterium]|nr:N-6 DNA methylase [Clostridia bacterium]